MTRRKSTSSKESRPSNLVVPRPDAKDRIETQIEKGIAIRDLPISSEEDLQRARAEHSKWSEYNTELLTRLFDNKSIADEYNRSYRSYIAVVSPNSSFSREVSDFRKDVQDNITRLEAILERLELIPESSEAFSSKANAVIASELESHIFLVHGHDEAAKETVARFIEKLDLKPIILHEQPNAGRTIIEKFVDYTNVGFTIVLITPDDVGAPANQKDHLQPRARQNVIFELGFFLGKLGRDRVCALYKEGVEIPSDYKGVLFVSMDESDWKSLLAREIKEAGISVDLNKVTQ
jgi:Predicted nucleotide-binding protein containing TIR -like domain